MTYQAVQLLKEAGGLAIRQANGSLRIPGFKLIHGPDTTIDMDVDPDVFMLLQPFLLLGKKVIPNNDLLRSSHRLRAVFSSTISFFRWRLPNGEKMLREHGIENIPSGIFDEIKATLVHTDRHFAKFSPGTIKRCLVLLTASVLPQARRLSPSSKGDTRARDLAREAWEAVRQFKAMMSTDPSPVVGHIGIPSTPAAKQTQAVHEEQTPAMADQISPSPALETTIISDDPFLTAGHSSPSPDPVASPSQAAQEEETTALPSPLPILETTIMQDDPFEHVEPISSGSLSAIRSIQPDQKEEQTPPVPDVEPVSPVLETTMMSDDPTPDAEPSSPSPTSAIRSTQASQEEEQAPGLPEKTSPSPAVQTAITLFARYRNIRRHFLPVDPARSNSRWFRARAALPGEAADMGWQNVWGSLAAESSPVPPPRPTAHDPSSHNYAPLGVRPGGRASLPSIERPPETQSPASITDSTAKPRISSASSAKNNRTPRSSNDPRSGAPSPSSSAQPVDSPQDFSSSLLDTAERGHASSPVGVFDSVRSPPATQTTALGKRHRPQDDDEAKEGTPPAAHQKRKRTSSEAIQEDHATQVSRLEARVAVLKDKLDREIQRHQMAVTSEDLLHRQVDLMRQRVRHVEAEKEEALAEQRRQLRPGLVTIKMSRWIQDRVTQLFGSTDAPFCLAATPSLRHGSDGNVSAGSSSISPLQLESERLSTAGATPTESRRVTQSPSPLPPIDYFRHPRPRGGSSSVPPATKTPTSKSSSSRMSSAQSSSSWKSIIPRKASKYKAPKSKASKNKRSKHSRQREDDEVDAGEVSDVPTESSWASTIPP